MMEDGKGKGESGRGRGAIPSAKASAEASAETLRTGFQPPFSPLHSPFSIFLLPSVVTRWGPVLAWMAGIFYFSSRSDPLSSVPSPGYGISVGNLAHVAEYAGLSILLHRALAWKDEEDNVSSSSDPLRAGNPTTTNPISASPNFTSHPSLVAFVVALIYALSDELHQELVSGRSFELDDVAYDLAGMVIALVFIWIRDHLRQSLNSK